MTIDFGNGKVSEFKLWGGKERRLIEQLIEDEMMTDKNILSILVDGCDSSKKFYTDDETNFILFNNYLNTFGQKIEKEWICSKCSKHNITKEDVDILLKNNKKTNLDKVTIKNITVTFKTPDYSNHSMFENLARKSDKLFLNMLLSIEKIEDDKIYSTITEIEDKLEEISISDFDFIFKYYVDNSFMFIPSVIGECTECKNKEEVFFDYLPNIAG